MFAEAVIIVDSENERLLCDVFVKQGQIETLVENWIERFSVHFGCQFALLVGQEEQLYVRIFTSSKRKHDYSSCLEIELIPDVPPISIAGKSVALFRWTLSRLASKE